MLVCSVVLRPKSRTLGAAVEEAVDAQDVFSTDAGFAVLVDVAGTASDTIDGFVGKLMAEAATAADVVSAGSIRNAAIVEETIALASPNATVIDSSGGIAAAMAEAASADGVPDATITAGTATAPIDGGFVTSTITATVLGSEISDSGPIAPFD